MDDVVEGLVMDGTLDKPETLASVLGDSHATYDDACAMGVSPVRDPSPSGAAGADKSARGASRSARSSPRAAARATPVSLQRSPANTVEEDGVVTTRAGRSSSFYAHDAVVSPQRVPVTTTVADGAATPRTASSPSKLGDLRSPMNVTSIPREKLIAFGGIPEAMATGLRSSTRIREQPNADATQMERAMDRANSRDMAGHTNGYPLDPRVGFPGPRAATCSYGLWMHPAGGGRFGYLFPGYLATV